jgi:hypothetical protein
MARPKGSTKSVARPGQDKKQYFTKDHENAILAYVKTDSLPIRTKLYIQFIEPSFSEMVEKISFTYKFNSLPNISFLKEECKIWLVTILDKFDVNKGYKAFSYFSIITKNWFIAKTKKNASQNKKEIQGEDLSKELEYKYYSDSNEYFEKREEAEFWIHFLQELDRWDDLAVKENEVKVLDGIKVLVANIEDIPIFNKKAIYFFLREITNLSTKQIVASLNKFKAEYKLFKNDWDNGETF